VFGARFYEEGMFLSISTSCTFDSFFDIKCSGLLKLSCDSGVTGLTTKSGRWLFDFFIYLGICSFLGSLARKEFYLLWSMLEGRELWAEFWFVGLREELLYDLG